MVLFFYFHFLKYEYFQAWIEKEKKKYLIKLKEFEVLFSKYEPLPKLQKILETKNLKSGWSQWENVSNNLSDLQELVQRMEEKNLILQRFGPFNEVKLKNNLMERLIREINKTK